MAKIPDKDKVLIDSLRYNAKWFKQYGYDALAGCSCIEAGADRIVQLLAEVALLAELNKLKDEHIDRLDISLLESLEAAV